MNIFYYQEKITSNQCVIDKIKPISRLLVVAKLLFFLLFATSAYGWIAYSEVAYPLLTILFLALYMLSYRLGMRYDDQLEFHRNLHRCYSDEIAYLNRDFSGFKNGEQFINPTHEYSFDLDLFGNDSLYQRINRTVTPQGAIYLARLLSSLPTNRSTVLKRQETISELSQQEEWRNRFRALGADSLTDLSAAINSLKKNSISIRFNSSPMLYILYLSVSIMLIVVVLAAFQITSWSWVLLYFLVQLGLTLPFVKTIFKSTESLNGLHQLFTRYRRILQHIAANPFQADELSLLKQSLVGNEENAITAVKKLSRLIGQLDSRNNLLGTILFNGFFLRDLFLIRAYNRWVIRYLPSFPRWMEQIGEFDALISLGNYQFNHPENTLPIIEENATSGFEFKHLYHPFLVKERAVGNNFSLSHSDFAIITGANMAGKSTFLRSIGVNFILAMNGLNVCAQSCRVPVVALFSSMRTTDNLAKNISYFNSELLRLEQLIDYCKNSPHTLIILDEILKGTNSADKLNGARLFLRKISQLPVTGLIATHDLELSKMEDESPRFKNFCFEIELNEEVNYSYTITKGVAKNMNATYLLTKILSRIDGADNSHHFLNQQ